MQINLKLICIFELSSHKSIKLNKKNRTSCTYECINAKQCISVHYIAIYNQGRLKTSRTKPNEKKNKKKTSNNNEEINKFTTFIYEAFT